MFATKLKEHDEELIEQGLKQGVQQGIKKGVQQGIKKGVQQGIKKGEIETARRMIKLGAEPISLSKQRDFPWKKLKNSADQLVSVATSQS